MEVAQNAIKFLSTLSEDQVRRFDIRDRVVVISWSRKVIGKYIILNTVQAKVDIISHKVKELINFFTPLVSRGIPFFWEEKGPLLSQKEYLDKLVNCRSDHSKFEDMHQTMSRRVVFDKLAGEFESLFDFKVMCAKLANFSYVDNMELRVLAYEMVVVDLPNPEHWRAVQTIWIN